jgi:hypothetical protein
MHRKCWYISYWFHDHSPETISSMCTYICCCYGTNVNLMLSICLVDSFRFQLAPGFRKCTTWKWSHLKCHISRIYRSVNTSSFAFRSMELIAQTSDSRSSPAGGYDVHHSSCRRQRPSMPPPHTMLLWPPRQPVQEPRGTSAWLSWRCESPSAFVQRHCCAIGR